jgi:hypothetical protein
MSRSYDEALDRAKRRYEETAELTISHVVQEIDFNKISRLHPRRVTETHLYVDFSKLGARAGPFPILYTVDHEKPPIETSVEPWCIRRGPSPLFVVSLPTGKPGGG